MLEVKKRYPTKMREYTGAYEVPEQLKPIVDDLLSLINLVLNAKQSYIAASIHINTFDDWSRFNVEFELSFEDSVDFTAQQNFINNIIDSAILEISKIDRFATFTFTIHNGYETVRNYKLVVNEEEDNPFKE